MSEIINFGKYKGKTLEWIFFNDPGYIWWMLKENIHNERFSDNKLQRFKDLVRRAKHLKIPGVCSWCKKSPITRMFLTCHIRGGLCKVDFDCDECKPECGSISTPLKPAFFTPDIYKNYDKTGAVFLIRKIKYAYYKDSSYRMTQKRLEEFFNNPDNFVNY